MGVLVMRSRAYDALSAITLVLVLMAASAALGMVDASAAEAKTPRHAKVAPKRKVILHKSWKGVTFCHGHYHTRSHHKTAAGRRKHDRIVKRQGRFVGRRHRHCHFKPSAAFKRHAKVSKARSRIVRFAKASLSSRTGHYRYSQFGATTWDPTPRYGRTDCSQWTRAIYKRATGRDIGWNTWAQARKGRRTYHPHRGDLMFSRSTGHVEIYLGHGRTIGHGSAPIDYAHVSYWPGHYFVTFLG